MPNWLSMADDNVVLSNMLNMDKTIINRHFNPNAMAPRFAVALLRTTPVPGRRFKGRLR